VITPEASPPRPLPIRPRPVSGESPDSYLRRLARANHLRPGYLRRYLRQPGGEGVILTSAARGGRGPRRGGGGGRGQRTSHQGPSGHGAFTLTILADRNRPAALTHRPPGST
jgi:hypothetical protein